MQNVLYYNEDIDFKFENNSNHLELFFGANKLNIHQI